MEYQPLTGVWEITMGCNMRCKHCGSSCENALEGQLTTGEALDLCDQLGEFKLRWLTLSGGEPTIRNDWHLIAKRLAQNKIIPNVISNGWLIDDAIIDKAVEAGVNTIAISVDGLEETHDFIRKPGSFKRIMNAFELIKRRGGVSASAITTINSRNINQLYALRDMLVDNGVAAWQVQIGLPMGNMGKNSELVMAPNQVDTVINFAHETMKENRIIIHLADCIGYYNLKEIEIRKFSSQSENYDWQGCPAGKYSVGILHNGDITGCTSIRDKQFIAGNIRKKPFAQIWNDLENFSQHRDLTKEQLKGFCRKCQYGRYCLGGCSNTRITINNDFYDENKYCSFHLAISKAKKELDKVADLKVIRDKIDTFLAHSNFQLAEILLTNALQQHETDIELLSLYGYVSFMLENYHEARSANEKVLKLNPGDAYAHKGLGLSLCRLGMVDAGIELLRKAIELADENFTDPYYDLAIILLEQDHKDEALAVLEEGRKKSANFIELSQPLFEQLTSV